MAATVGIALHRRAVHIAVVERRGTVVANAVQRRLERIPGQGLDALLRTVLAELPPAARKARLVIALSPGDLPCSDAWLPPEGLKPSALTRVGPSLCEARCAGESIETLAIDVVQSGTRLQGIAILRETLDALIAATAGLNLVAVTSIPAVLAALAPELSFICEGERFEINGGGWRALPVEATDSLGTHSCMGMDIPLPLLAAVAAAVAETESIPNALRATPAGRPSFAKRYRDPLLNLAAAGALCLAAFGVRFHQDLKREEAELETLRRAELSVWNRLLPGDDPRPGRLLKAMSDRLGDLGESPGGADFPSALAFWSEIAAQMPDPEALGLTLETLDLAPDGGRLSARVPAVKEDPLKNASQLEGRLNQSKKMTTRGDYEVRDGQVQVRLRMDYRP